jgi:Flp pilus assembly protein TadG
MKTSNSFPTKKSRGAAAVEVAIVLPVLIVLTFGALKYGWLFYKHQQVTNAARQVARVAIRPGNRAADISDMFETVTTDSKGANMLPGATCSVNPAGGAQEVGNAVQVTVEISADKVDIVKMNTLLPTPEVLRATVTMSKEGPQ